MEEGEGFLRKGFILLLISVFLVCVGCGDQLYLENTELALLIGFDLAENGDIVLYSFRPIFEKEIVKKYEVMKVQEPLSLRNIRKKVSTITSGYLNVRKLQVVLFSKRLLKQRNMYPFLNELFRDPKSELNAKVAVFDGSLEEIANFPWQSKGQPGVILPRILEQGLHNGTALLSTLTLYRKQLVDPRITPYITELYRYQDHIRVKGTALLDQKGRYRLSLNPEESSYVMLLKGDLKKSLSLTFDDLGFHLGSRSIGIEVFTVDRSIHTKIKNNQPVISVELNIDADVTERGFYLPIEKKKYAQELEERLADAIRQRCNRIIQKLQQHQVDPVGWGYDLRAQQYSWWNEQQDQWLTIFPRAKITIQPKVKVEDYGASM